MSPSISIARQRANEWWFRLFDNDTHLAVFWMLNAVLAVAVRSNSLLATAHAAGVTLLAIGIALTGKRSEQVAYAVAFIVGTEVLWRMGKASVFYEISKYSTAICCFIAVARMKKKHIPVGAIVYILLLLPAAVTTIMLMPFSKQMHKMLSFNLSGPIAVAAAICFFSNIKMSQAQIWRTVLILITAILSVASVAAFWTHTSSDEELSFGTESNKVSAGGFGPNQVSSTLGLGAALILLVLAQRLSARRRMLLSGALLICLIQSALTFSRSGLYAAAGAFCAALVFLLRDRSIRKRLAYLAVAGAAVIIFAVIPYLVAFTGGVIEKRFASTKLSGRDKIMATDMRLWQKNPYYGTGVGVSSWYHNKGNASHNEFSRLLAEHGIFGAGAIATLLLLALHRMLLARSTVERAFVAVMFSWPLLFMMVNGFRIAAPAFVIGLGCVTFKQVTAPVLRPAEYEEADYPVQQEEEEVYP